MISKMFISYSVGMKNTSSERRQHKSEHSVPATYRTYVFSCLHDKHVERILKTIKILNPDTC